MPVRRQRHRHRAQPRPELVIRDEPGDPERDADLRGPGRQGRGVLGVPLGDGADTGDANRLARSAKTRGSGQDILDSLAGVEISEDSDLQLVHVRWWWRAPSWFDRQRHDDDASRAGPGSVGVAATAFERVSFVLT